MPYTTPSTITTGQLVTATLMNNEWAGNIAYLANPPHCALRHSVTQSHATSSTWQALVFDTEDEDTAAMHSTVSNTSRITVPVTGLYVVSAEVTFAFNANGLRAVGFRANGSGTSGPNKKGRIQTWGVINSDTYLSVATTLKLSANDYLEVVAFQNSGAALNLAASTTECYPYFTATWVGLG